MIILVLCLPGSEPYSLLYGRDYRGVVCGSKKSVCNRERYGVCSGCEGDAAACAAYETEQECTAATGSWAATEKGVDPPSVALDYLPAPEAGTCGKYTAYPRIDRDVKTGLAAGLRLPDDFNKFEFYGVCVHECPRSSTFVCNYDYEQKMKHEFSLSGGRVPAKEPYQTVDEDGNTAADWEPAPGEPSIYGGSRGEFLKHCWGALLRAAASSLTTSVSGVGPVKILQSTFP